MRAAESARWVLPRLTPVPVVGQMDLRVQTAWGRGGIQVPPHVPSGALVGAVVRGVVRNSAQCQSDIFYPPTHAIICTM